MNWPWGGHWHCPFSCPQPLIFGPGSVAIKHSLLSYPYVSVTTVTYSGGGLRLGMHQPPFLIISYIHSDSTSSPQADRLPHMDLNPIMVWRIQALKLNQMKMKGWPLRTQKSHGRFHHGLTSVRMIIELQQQQTFNLRTFLVRTTATGRAVWVDDTHSQPVILRCALTLTMPIVSGRFHLLGQML